MLKAIVSLTFRGEVDIPITLSDGATAVDFIDKAKDEFDRHGLNYFEADVHSVESVVVGLTKVVETERRTALVDVEGQVAVELEVPKGISLDEFATQAVKKAAEQYDYMLSPDLSPKYYFFDEV